MIAVQLADVTVLRFDEFMAEALYGPQGFYSQGGRAGRRGDFITSPEVGPLFGAVIARAIDEWWRQAGSPTEFTVIDAGAGPGTLARGVLAAKPDVLVEGALRYVCVEVSAAQRALHSPDVLSLAEMPHGPITGVVIANELLDNLPFRLMVFDGGWCESFVRRSLDGEWVPVEHPHRHQPLLCRELGVVRVHRLLRRDRQRREGGPARRQHLERPHHHRPQRIPDLGP